MSKSEFAQDYTERMFPDIAAPAGYIDPEFEVFFDKASQFSGIDSSRNYVFGINVVNMHNNQYGEATLFKYLVHPSLHTVYRFSPDGQAYQITPGSNEYNMFLAAWKEVYGTDFSFPAL